MTATRTARWRTGVPLLTLVGLVGCLSFCTRGSDAPGKDTSDARASDEPPAPPPPSNDHAVYTLVLREHFVRPQRGEHALLCESEEPSRRLTIVGTTQPLPAGTPPRDSGWANELPAPARSLMAALRAMDRQPGRALDEDSLAVGIPVDLVPDSVATRELVAQPATSPAPNAPPLYWVSRIAYTADSNWALVYAVRVCPGITEAKAADAENGAYESVLLAPLEWRGGAWTVHSPVYLDVGLPRLGPRQASSHAGVP